MFDWTLAAQPPDTARTVLVLMQYGGTALGYYRAGQWRLVTDRLVNVTHWAERPGSLSPAPTTARTRRGAR